jgi:hypothetical protein
MGGDQVRNQGIDRLKLVGIAGNVISEKLNDVVSHARLRFGGWRCDGLVGGVAQKVNVNGDSVSIVPFLYKPFDRLIPAGDEAAGEGDG